MVNDYQISSDHAFPIHGVSCHVQVFLAAWKNKMLIDVKVYRCIQTINVSCFSPMTRPDSQEKIAHHVKSFGQVYGDGFFNWCFKRVCFGL